MTKQLVEQHFTKLCHITMQPHPISKTTSIMITIRYCHIPQPNVCSVKLLHVMCFYARWRNSWVHVWRDHIGATAAEIFLFASLYGLNWRRKNPIMQLDHSVQHRLSASCCLQAEADIAQEITSEPQNASRQSSTLTGRNQQTVPLMRKRR